MKRSFAAFTLAMVAHASMAVAAPLTIPETVISGDLAGFRELATGRVLPLLGTVGCEPFECNEWIEGRDGSLACDDSGDRYPAGQWSYAADSLLCFDSTDDDPLTWRDLVSIETIACVPTACERWTAEPSGALLCFDFDERYPAGHWTFGGMGDASQVTVEY